MSYDESPKQRRRRLARIDSPVVKESEQVMDKDTSPSTLLTEQEPTEQQFHELASQIETANVNSIENKFLHIKVGNLELEEAGVDINKLKETVEEQIDEFIKDNEINCLLLVTHYAVDIKVF